MRKIILCADDFAENPSISQGILTLVEKRRISAVSCLTNGAYWKSWGPVLKEHRAAILLGLHFNLTLGTALTSCKSICGAGETFPHLSRLLLKTHLRIINQQEIYNELIQQLENFLSVVGRLPDFIDGHQHVHHLPVVRVALLRAYQQYFPEKNCLIRVSLQNNQLNFKTTIKEKIIALTGAAALKQQLLTRNIPHNTSFGGIYHFAQATSYPEIFQKFLNKSEEGGLIMCHPGLAGAVAVDPIAASRVHEYNYFISEDFVADCRNYGINVQ